MQDIGPLALHELLQGPAPPALVDVRESWEYEHASIDGSVHVPMAQIPTRHAELPKDRPLVVVCHHGVRSRQVALFLEHLGFQEVYNLAGGIHAWSCEVDPAVPMY